MEFEKFKTYCGVYIWYCCNDPRVDCLYAQSLVEMLGLFCIGGGNLDFYQLPEKNQPSWILQPHPAQMPTRGANIESGGGKPVPYQVNWTVK